MLIGRARVRRLSAIIASQLDRVGRLRSGGRKVFVDALAHALEIRCEPRIVEAIASPFGIGSAAMRAVGQLFYGSDLPLH
ncbi:hypothetical protein D3C72_2130780 [compost metagenome]